MPTQSIATLKPDDRRLIESRAASLVVYKLQRERLHLQIEELRQQAGNLAESMQATEGRMRGILLHAGWGEMDEFAVRGEVFRINDDGGVTHLGAEPPEDEATDADDTAEWKGHYADATRVA